MAEKRCKKIDEVGILCGDKPWDICDRKTFSPLCFCTDTEERRIFKSKHFIIEKQPMILIWRVVEDFFNKNSEFLWESHRTSAEFQSR